MNVLTTSLSTLAVLGAVYAGVQNPNPQSPEAIAQRYSTADGTLRVALAQQPFSPNGTVMGPRTMAEGGIQPLLAGLGRDHPGRGSRAHRG